MNATEGAVIDDGLNPFAGDIVHHADEADRFIRLATAFGDPAYGENQTLVGPDSSCRDCDEVVAVISPS